MAQSSVSVTSSGSSPIATFAQTQNGSTVQVQQLALVDPSTGQASVVDNLGLHIVEEKGAPNTSGTITNGSIVGGANATLTSSVVVTSGKTGTLQHAIFAGTAPMLWQVQTLNNSSAATTVATIVTDANQSFDLKPGSNGEISTVLSTGVATFQVVASNLSTNTTLSGAAYATFYWAEN